MNTQHRILVVIEGKAFEFVIYGNLGKLLKKMTNIQRLRPSVKAQRKTESVLCIDSSALLH